MDDYTALKMHVDFIRFFESWREILQTPIEINVEQIIGGGQPLTRVNDTNVTVTLGGTPATALLKAVSLTLGWSGTLSLARGGTAAALAASNGGIVYSGAAALAISAVGSSGQILRSGGAGAPTWSTATFPSTATPAGAYLRADGTNWITSTLLLPNAATTGDVFYASASNTMAALADVSAGSYLRSGGVGVAPLWSTLKLPNAAATGDLLYASSANTLVVRTIGSTGDVLTVTGGVPVWAPTSGLGTGDLTRVDDTNVTLTLGGTPVDALFKDVSLTLGWTGTLGLARGGTNANLSATGGTSQYLKQASAGAAITVGTIPASDIASGAALTRTDDTNVTLTLGGSPTTALLAATSLTLGWTGLLGVTRGGTGATTFTQGSVVFAGASGVYTQDNSNFFYNASSIRLGIGTPSPGSILHLKAASFPTLNIEGTTTAGGILQLTSSTNNWQMYASSGNLKWDVNVTSPTGTKLLLSNNGLLQLGTTATIATATFAFFLGDGTAPTAGIMPANTGALYVDSFGTSGLFGIDATGIINRLTDSARGRSTAQTAAVASVTTFTLGATDTSFLVVSVVTVTTSTTHNFTVNVDYTDETNTAQSQVLTFAQPAGGLVTAITNVTGAGPYNGVPLQIRCKASTAITMKTVGTFTTVTYNVEGRIRQVTG